MAIEQCGNPLNDAWGINAIDSIVSLRQAATSTIDTSIRKKQTNRILTLGS